jgi:hypothetical protein
VDANGLWDIAGNWVDDQGVHRLPGFNDDVYLDRPAGAFTITHAQNSDNIHSLHASVSSLALTGGTLIVRSTSNIDSSLTISGGDLGAQGPLSLNGTTSWTGGTIDNDGPTINNGTFTLSGSDIKLLQGTLTNHNLITQTGTGDLHIGAFAHLNNQSTGLFDLQSDANVVGDGAFTGTFANVGTLRKSGGSSTSLVSAVANQGGAIDVESGSLGLGTAGKSNTGGGTFTVAAGSVLDLTSGGTSDSFAGTYTGSGGGLVVLQSGTLNVASTGATFDFPSYMFRWKGGTIASNSSPGLTNIGTMVLASPNTKTLSATLNDAGLMVQVGAGNLVIPAFDTLNIRSGGAYVLYSDASILGQGSFSGAINNVGTFIKLNRGGISEVDPAFANSGTLEVDTGTIAFTQTVNQTAGTTDLAGGNLIVTTLNIQRGTLTGSGVITGNVQNGGELDVGGSGAAGVLTINGNYTQTATGVLDIELGDAAQGEFDQLQVTGRATLGGTINVTLLPDFSANVGDSFQILTFASRSGDFATYNLPNLGELVLSPVFDDHSLTLVTNSAG